MKFLLLERGVAAIFQKDDEVLPAAPEEPLPVTTSVADKNIDVYLGNIRLRLCPITIAHLRKTEPVIFVYRDAEPGSELCKYEGIISLEENQIQGP